MISKLGQVMVYVDDQDKAVKFWTQKVGFSVITNVGEDKGMRWIEIAPSKDPDTTIVLHDREVVSKMSPDLNLDTPSLMFYTNELEKLYADFKEKGVTVGELVNMPTGRVFNFADDEDNYFAVMEKLEK
ncbi:VOC family protein [Planococcus salinus]|uniref:VOC family protein n=1 Tax=Planococcus salinus TaxID=1848460 RepID=A0A3M8P5D9_9BACL|nr:VOC family protein [Planococcus salinus]RNF38887.1 VOC family protein [Planococcus salinus]